jgi:peptidoglycan/xylan/chitin deacetylase (PgdA/CDA1 family)
MTSALVLMYHSIDDDPRDPWYLRVDPPRFEEHLRLLRASYRPSTLQEIAAGAVAGDIHPGSVAVTFDDGYANNLTHAVPALEHQDVPATVFVATGFVEHQRPYWWEDLEELFLGSGSLPSEVEVTLNGALHRWRLGSAAATKSPGDWERRWRSHDPPPSTRHASFVALASILKRMVPTARDRAMEELKNWAGGRVAPGPGRAPLTVEQLHRLAACDLIEIGAHSVWHPLLPLLRPEERRSELTGSKDWLQSVLGIEVKALAYPDGACDADTKQTAADCRFATAWTTEEGAITPDADLLALPRLAVENWPADVLDERLRSVMGGGSAS